MPGDLLKCLQGFPSDRAQYFVKCFIWNSCGRWADTAATFCPSSPSQMLKKIITKPTKPSARSDGKPCICMLVVSESLPFISLLVCSFAATIYDIYSSVAQKRSPFAPEDYRYVTTRDHATYPSTFLEHI